jgi:DNA polymerase V
MYALVDCNNFYASCERVFRPELVGKPIVVLSLNDGCVIALSNESKALGLHVGSAYFENKKLFAQHGVTVFSANFPLYGNMSGRVMEILGEFSSHVEVYSIDEAFLNLEGMSFVDLQAHALRMRQRVTKCTGIPVCVGVAATKTLAKAANRIAKKFQDKTGGAYVIDTEEKRVKALKWLKIGDVWGIGRKHAKRLKEIDVQTAYAFTQLTDAWVLKNMAVVGLRLKHELLGIPQPDADDPLAKKNITTTRSFETNYTELDQLRERISTFAIACASKLRKQHSLCSALMVFIDTNRHREDLPQYSRSLALSLPFPTNSSIEISKFASQALVQIFKEGYHYKRAGVSLFEFSPEGQGQISMFHNSNPRHTKLMEVLDKMNLNYGQHTVKLASQDQQRMWLARQEMLSPSYATRLRDVIVVRC